MARTKSKAETVGVRAANLAKETANKLGAGAKVLSVVTDTAEMVFTDVTNMKAQAQGAVVDAKQVAGASGSKVKLSEIVLGEDAYGGLVVPELDLPGMIPTDLINPNIATTATQEQLTAGLENYAGATRAQKLYQAGFSYIAEVGKTKQLFHKAQASVIKGATEGVKVQQELVRFDRQQVELETDLVKRDQSLEKLTQEQTKLMGLQKETTQLTRKIEAVELKRDAEIQAVQAQTQMILQKYMVESINN